MLVPVDVSADRVIRDVAGLRPYRPSGFRLECESIDGKTIVHNYGHGGGGVTLSWGSANMAVAEARPAVQTTYAVLGAGAVGLATGRLLQQEGASVTIYARELPPNTTSYIAGALFRPGTGFDSNRVQPEFLDRLERALRISHRHFEEMIGPHYGVAWVDNYFLSEKKLEDADFLVSSAVRARVGDLYPGGVDLPSDAHPFSAAYVHRHRTLLIEPPVYLQALIRDFQQAGGKIVRRDFKSIADILQLPEPVIMNCTGLGAKILFRDEELTPVKGQLTVLAPQPEVGYVVYQHELYMIPRLDGILLGGTYEHGNWNLEPDPTAKQRIVAGHRQVFSRFRS